MKLSSPSFEDGEHIPEKHGYTQENVNPPLKIKEVPEEAESLALVMDDPDAVKPAGKVWDHWTIWNIDPEKRKIKEGEKPGEEGMNDFGRKGYGGPNPPDRIHTYRLRLYALDQKIDLGPKTKKEDLEKAMEGHKIEEAKLEGKFDPI